MGLTLETVVFYFLAVFIIAMSILTVTTQRIVRSATYLLFVLFGTAGIYFLLGYTSDRYRSWSMPEVSWCSMYSPSY